MLNYHLRRRYREDNSRRRRRRRSTRERGRGARRNTPRGSPRDTRRGLLLRYLSRKRITKRNIVEPYISDGALMKHSRSRHSEITRDRLDVLPGCGSTGGCSLFTPRRGGSDGVERIPAIFNENKRTPSND